MVGLDDIDDLLKRVLDVSNVLLLHRNLQLIIVRYE